MLQLLRQNVRGIGPEVRSKKFAHLRLRQFREVLGELRFGIPPWKVIVRLSEAQFRQAGHHLGPCESLRKKNDVRVCLFHLPDDPLPKGEGLRMRIIDPEYEDPLLDPVHDDALQFIPQFPPLVCLKVQRNDVLIFFRWVLRILHRAVRPDSEPLTMFLHVGMIGRALKRDIQGDLDAIRACLLYQFPKVLQASQLRVNRRMASLQSADSPWTARISGIRGRRIILPLPMSQSNGMNRRKVQHVEPHRCDVGQARFAVFERAVLAGLEAACARKHLVPGAEACFLSIHDNAQFSVIRRYESPIRVLRHQGLNFSTQGYAKALRVRRLLRPELFTPRRKNSTLLRRCPPTCLINELGPDQEVHLYILLSLDFFEEVSAPRDKAIDPACYGVSISPDHGHWKRGAPAVVSKELHRNVSPLLDRLWAIS